MLKKHSSVVVSNEVTPGSILCRHNPELIPAAGHSELPIDVATIEPEQL
jgi:hypothetical protein